MAEFDEGQDVAGLEFPEELDPNRVPTFSQMPLGRLELEIKGWSQDTVATAPRNDPNGEKVAKVVVKVQFAVAETPDHKFIGLPNTKTFWIGTDSDPMAKSPATWMANAGPLMKVLKKAKVATSKGIKFRQMMDASVGSHLLGEVKESKKTGRRDIMDFLTVGEKPIEYFGDAATAAPASAPVGISPLNPPSVFDNE